MDKNNIKKHLFDRFIKEASIPGLEITKSVQKKEDDVNKASYKATEKEMGEYDKAAIEPVKVNYATDDQKTYHDEMEIRNGQEMLRYGNEPNAKFKERAESAIKGDSKMGNKVYTGKDNGNTESIWNASDDKYGEKLIKTVKDSAKKRENATPSMTSFGDDIELTPKKPASKTNKVAVENKENNNNIIKEESKMKRLKFKKPFNGLGNALTLIPESYRTNDKVFEMTDGNEKYKIRWEGSLTEGKAVVLLASDKKRVNENIDKMKHLFNYNSKDTLGTVKGTSRVDENAVFNDIYNKTKKLLSEGDMENIPVKNGNFDDADVKFDSKNIPSEAGKKLQTKDSDAPAPKADNLGDAGITFDSENIPSEAGKKLQTKDSDAPAPKADNLGDAGIKQAAEAKKHIHLSENEEESEDDNDMDDAEDDWSKPSPDDDDDDVKEPSHSDIKKTSLSDLNNDNDDDAINIPSPVKEINLFRSKSGGNYILVATKQNGKQESLDVPEDLIQLARENKKLAYNKIISRKEIEAESLYEGAEIDEAEIKKGKFTKWCKANGFPDGPSIACAKKAEASESTSAHKMSAFYMNTVQPKGKTAKDI